MRKSLDQIVASLMSAPFPDEAAVAAEQAAREKSRRAEMFRSFIGNRERYRNCRLDEWNFSAAYDDEQRRVVNGVAEYIAIIDTHRQTATGALFYGPPGTGKDHLATCIIRAACLDHGHGARYVNGMDWFGVIRDAMDDDGKKESSIIADCARPDWLLLSDPLPPVGVLTTHQAAMLYRLIDARNAARKPTVVTINVKSNRDAEDRMGGPVWDRMKDGAWVFPCAWPTFRKPAKEF